MPFIKKWAENEDFRPGYYLDATSRVVRARDTDYHLALAIDDYRRAGGEAALRNLPMETSTIATFDRSSHSWMMRFADVLL
jgi:hypothetical protein